MLRKLCCRDNERMHLPLCWDWYWWFHCMDFQGSCSPLCEVFNTTNWCLVCGKNTLFWTGLEAWCILCIDYLRTMYFKGPKGYQWAFSVAILNMEKIKQLTSLSGFSELFSVVALLWGDEQQAHCHHNSAPAVILQQLRFLGSHLQANSPIGDPMNDQCLLNIS